MGRPLTCFCGWRGCVDITVWGLKWQSAATLMNSLILKLRHRVREWTVAWITQQPTGWITWIHSAFKQEKKFEQFKLVPLYFHKHNISSASKPLPLQMNNFSGVLKSAPLVLFFCCNLSYFLPLSRSPLSHFLWSTPSLPPSALNEYEKLSSSPSLFLSGLCVAAEVNLTLLAFLMGALWKSTLL